MALIPLALHGVRFALATTAGLLRRNLLIYGAVGLIAPFVLIKVIDLVITGLGLV
jgi:potassium-transporting ATPase ATP-binding subunit